MEISLSTIMSGVYVFTPGRRIFAYGATLQRVKDHRLDDVITHIRAAMAHDDRLLDMMAKYARPTTSAGEADMRRLDQQVDRAIGAFGTGLAAHASLPTDDPCCQAAVRISDDIFPAGVGAVTMMTHAEEAVEVDRIVKRLRNEHAKDVALLNLGHFVDRLHTVNATFRVALGKPRPQGVTYDEVRAAQARGQELLLQTIVMILGRFPGRTDAELQTRVELLGPIMQQNESIGAYRRNRRPVQDVDPKTGQEVVPVAPEFIAPEV